MRRFFVTSVRVSILIGQHGFQSVRKLALARNPKPPEVLSSGRITVYSAVTGWLVSSHVLDVLDAVLFPRCCMETY